MGGSLPNPRAPAVQGFCIYWLLCHGETLNPIPQTQPLNPYPGTALWSVMQTSWKVGGGCAVWEANSAIHLGYIRPLQSRTSRTRCMYRDRDSFAEREFDLVRTSYREGWDAVCSVLDPHQRVR